MTSPATVRRTFEDLVRSGFEVLSTAPTAQRADHAYENWHSMPRAPRPATLDPLSHLAFIQALRAASHASAVQIRSTPGVPLELDGIHVVDQSSMSWIVPATPWRTDGTVCFDAPAEIESARGDWVAVIGGRYLQPLEEDITQSYWGLVPEVTPHWISRITSALHQLHVPHALKVAARWELYERPNAVCLWVPDEHLPGVVPTLRGVAAKYSRWLRRPPPGLSMHFARGVGFAQRPRGSLSFGAWWSNLISESFEACGEAPTIEDFRASLLSNMESNGIDPQTPFQRGTPRDR